MSLSHGGFNPRVGQSATKGESVIFGRWAISGVTAIELIKKETMIIKAGAATINEN